MGLREMLVAGSLAFGAPNADAKAPGNAANRDFAASSEQLDSHAADLTPQQLIEQCNIGKKTSARVLEEVATTFGKRLQEIIDVSPEDRRAAERASAQARLDEARNVFSILDTTKSELGVMYEKPLKGNNRDRKQTLEALSGIQFDLAQVDAYVKYLIDAQGRVQRIDLTDKAVTGPSIHQMIARAGEVGVDCSDNFETYVAGNGFFPSESMSWHALAKSGRELRKSLAVGLTPNVDVETIFPIIEADGKNDDAKVLYLAIHNAMEAQERLRKQSDEAILRWEGYIATLEGSQHVK